MGDVLVIHNGEDLAALIRSRRAELERILATTSADAGLSLRHLSRIERGFRNERHTPGARPNPKFETLLHLSKALNVPILIDGRGGDS